jgi:RNA polymerase sigma-70 factor (ECF subfamily)
VDDALERFRVELTGYCYRMLGSPFEAEDAVQETFVRALRNRNRYDAARASMRTWLYAIATNICLDMLRGAGRRARAMDMGPAATVGNGLGAPLPASAWVQPIADARAVIGRAVDGRAVDGRAVIADGDPADVAAQRESIRLAFVAALQHLPPRQRAVLILRDVLCWKADEVAALLDTTVASVTSALQRARAGVAGLDPETVDPYRPADPEQRALLARYCDAFERYDVDALVGLLRADAVMSMPPFAWWLSGRDDIAKALRAADQPCAGTRLVPTAANGCPAFAQYRPPRPGDRPEPFALVVVELSGGLIASTTTFLHPELFPLFDLR